MEEDDHESEDEGANNSALRRRTWRLRQHVKSMRGEVEALKADAASMKQAHAAELEGLRTELGAAHTIELEAAKGEYTGHLSQLERLQTLTAAGVEAEGFDIVLSVYDRVEDAPPLADWLSSEGLPRGVTAYLTAPKGDAGDDAGDDAAPADDAPPKPPGHNPDAGVGGRPGNASAGVRPGFLANATVEDLRALEAQKLL